MAKKKWAKIGKVFTGCSDTLSQSIERGRFSREGSLAVLESQDQGDTKIPPKPAKTQFWSDSFLNESSNNSFAWGISISWTPRKSKLLGRGEYNFKIGWPVTIVGHIQACPTHFLAQKTCVILKKRWPNFKCFLGYKLAAPRKAFVVHPFGRANTGLPFTKIWLWASFGV